VEVAATTGAPEAPTPQSTKSIVLVTAFPLPFDDRIRTTATGVMIEGTIEDGTHTTTETDTTTVTIDAKGTIEKIEDETVEEGVMIGPEVGAEAKENHATITSILEQTKMTWLRQLCLCEA
jgi:hypothetical protein